MGWSRYLLRKIMWQGHLLKAFLFHHRFDIVSIILGN